MQSKPIIGRTNLSPTDDTLFQPCELPCGVALKNRIVKSAMSDSLGDGYGNPTNAQTRLYERWAHGGVAASLVGEVQCSPDYAEKPGNLVLNADSDHGQLKTLAQRGASEGTQLWLQLGHAGAMAYPPTSQPKGPSAIDVPGLSCTALSLNEIRDLPCEFAKTARLAQQLGFGGVQIHAAHGFLLSQFLSPLFNQRNDAYGGSAAKRMRLLLEVVEEVRGTVDPAFVVAVKLNATDQLEGGFQEHESLDVVAALDKTKIDLIEISGGTYFPGARSASDSSSDGPYFLEFVSQAQKRTAKPLMITGGFKTKQQAVTAITSGCADLIGIARGFALDPDLPKSWQADPAVDPSFPRFPSPPEGGITAWYTMRLTQIGEDRETDDLPDLDGSVKEYEERDSARAARWRKRFK